MKDCVGFVIVQIHTEECLVTIVDNIVDLIWLESRNLCVNTSSRLASVCRSLIIISQNGKKDFFYEMSPDVFCYIVRSKQTTASSDYREWFIAIWHMLFEHYRSPWVEIRSVLAWPGEVVKFYDLSFLSYFITFLFLIGKPHMIHQNSRYIM